MFLITRDIENSLEIEKILKSHGFSTFIEPMLNLDISPAMEVLPAVKDFVEEVESRVNYSFRKVPLFIITSKNAVKSLFSINNSTTEMHSILMFLLQKLCEVVVVGTSVKNLLIASLDTINKTQYNVDINKAIKTCININELYNFILCSVSKAQTMIYLSGEDIKKNIDIELMHQGYEIRRFIIYRMISSKSLSVSLIDKIKKDEIRYVIIYSVRTAQIFTNLVLKYGLYNNVSKLTFFVLSKEIAEALEYKNVIYPKLPNNDFLLKCILSHLH